MELKLMVMYLFCNYYSFLLIALTVSSFVDLVKYVFTIPGVKYFLSERLSQDLLENFFGCQCQRGGTNENPTVQKILYKHYSPSYSELSMWRSEEGKLLRK